MSSSFTEGWKTHKQTKTLFQFIVLQNICNEERAEIRSCQLPEKNSVIWSVTKSFGTICVALLAATISNLSAIEKH